MKAEKIVVDERRFCSWVEDNCGGFYIKGRCKHCPHLDPVIKAKLRARAKLMKAKRLMLNLQFKEIGVEEFNIAEKAIKHIRDIIDILEP